MIHAPRSIVTLWKNLNLVERQGNLILTINDTIVVPGAGYDGSGPDGQPAAANSMWVYGTGLVDVRLGTIEVVGGPNAQGLDRTNNDIIIRASRMAAATFDPCVHLAVEIAASPCGIGGS